MEEAKYYKGIIRPMLGDKRYNHSLEVAKAAKKLAKKYGADVEKAEVAGILHDITKDTPLNEQLKIMNRFCIILTDIENRTPNLWHQISGAAYIKNILGITDLDIVEPVRWHTSGKSGMNLLEKVIFVADFISADRDYKGVEKMRTLAKESLEAAMVEGLAFTINELSAGNKLICMDTVNAYNEALLCVKKG